MADRILHWHVPGVLSESDVEDTDVQGNAFYIDKDYQVVDTWMRVKKAPQDNEGLGIQIDINDDGASIFDEGQEPILGDNATESKDTPFSDRNLVIQEGSVVTLDIDHVGTLFPGEDLVVELHLIEDD